MTLDRTSYEGETIGVELPVTVDLQVTSTEPGFAGDTAQGARKPATLQTGLVVQVPLFVQEGDTIRVDTRTGEYQTRSSRDRAGRAAPTGRSIGDATAFSTTSRASCHGRGPRRAWSKHRSTGGVGAAQRSAARDADLGRLADDAFWMEGGPNTRRFRNLAANPAAVVTVERENDAVILEASPSW